jgi:hypothetical protein
MRIGTPDCRNLDRTVSLEWLETNGRWGFVSGTIAEHRAETARPKMKTVIVLR